jgi:ubiquinone/menaquinone biosynthesis C-methylase UbiE
MEDREQARAYADADFEEPHARFIELMTSALAGLGERGHALDLGCGNGDITLRFARAYPQWQVDGVDGSPAMLELGREAVAQAGLAGRVRLIQARLPDEAPPRTGYDLVFSNSLLHHLGDPQVLWRAIRRFAAPGAAILVQDLLRPDSPAAAAALVDTHASGEPELLRRDFYNSLRAAYRVEEVRSQLAAAGLSHLEVQEVSDRHLAVWGTLR